MRPFSSFRTKHSGSLEPSEVATPRRRSGDPDDSDGWRQRNGVGPFNGHTKWVVGVVSTALVSALAFLLVQDRAGFDRRLINVEDLARVTAGGLQAHEARASAQYEEIKKALERIENHVEEVRKQRR